MSTLAIATASLTRRFGDNLAVDDLDLIVPRGCVYGFLGPNGAGKTTTIRMLLGLIRPTAGGVMLFGQSLRRYRQQLLRRVGALVESPSLYRHLTGRENLEVSRRLLGIDSTHIDRALEIVDLKEVANRLVSHYSMGMCQRLGIALALLNEPEMLILDEPTNGLDPAGIHEMRALICHLASEKGITVFLSSHLLSEVEQVATHIGILQKGRLLFQGTLEDLNAHVQLQVVLDVGEPELAGRVLVESGWTLRSNGNRRLVVAANRRSDAALVNAQLVRAGVNVYELALEKPNLEDIFLTLTEEAVC